MQNTFLEKNPFYLLEILPSDKRETIISKAEEKAFFANGNEYEEAQASLITPTRRLTAELEWFFDVSATDYAQIIDSVKNNKEICIYAQKNSFFVFWLWWIRPWFYRWIHFQRT